MEIGDSLEAESQEYPECSQCSPDKNMYTYSSLFYKSKYTLKCVGGDGREPRGEAGVHHADERVREPHIQVLRGHHHLEQGEAVALTSWPPMVSINFSMEQSSL